jgi:hypothetical protein
MYNSQGNQQLYSAQGSPQIYTPNGTKQPYNTNQLAPQMYSAQGTPQNIEHFQDARPAFLSDDARQRYWNERSARGFPVGASESENKGEEKPSWVANDPAFIPVDIYPMPPTFVQDSAFAAHTTTPTNFRGATEREIKGVETPSKIPGERPNNTANKGCFYTANGQVKCNM